MSKTPAIALIASSLLFVTRATLAQPGDDTAAPATAAPATAAEQDADVCTSSYEHAQVMMKPSPGQPARLVQAREQLHTCLRSGCKDWMVADCSRWLPEVDARIPTVVFSARNTAKRDLIDVRVTTPGGEELAARLDGRAIEMEPGEQSFVFVGPDGVKVERHVLVREGEKAQSVAAVFDATAEELAALSPATGTTAPAVDRGPRTSTSTLQYVGYGAAGAGVIGLGVGAVFGVSALMKKGDANCDASGECDDPHLSDARSAARTATIGFIAGGVLLAGGLSLVLFAPPRVNVVASAALRPGGGTFGIGGHW
ncbi:MAG: hypothetical protein KIS78_13540 [Labilithrix sp.]|nr:hypothetical protein [Labilithrix sp.]